MKLTKTILSLMLAATASVYAGEIPNDFSISGGYRQDDTQFKGVFTSPAAAGVQTDDLHVRHLNVWQIGFKGRYFMPQLDCLCDYSFLDNFYITGHAYWGKAFGNKNFSENVDSSTTGLITHSKGDLKNYLTNDFQIGLGYLFDLGCWAQNWGCIGEYLNDFSVGITGGYSYNRQKFTIKNGLTVFADGTGADPDTFYTEGDNRYFSRWSAGYVGVDLFKKWDNTLINLGYEHHFAHYNAGSNVGAVAVADGASSDRRHDKNAHGDVVYLNSTYAFCDGWTIGSGFKWSYFQAKHAHINPVGVGATRVVGDSAKGKWQSYALTLDLGYAF